MPAYKDKTIATLLAALFGGIGAHRFYLYGWRDRWAWLHILILPLAILIGFATALVLGLTPDEIWNQRHNAQTDSPHHLSQLPPHQRPHLRPHLRQYAADWKLAVILVLTFMVGATLLISLIARGLDLFLTAGAYG